MESEIRHWGLRLGYLIHDVSRLRRVNFDRELSPLGITRSQWWVLAFISRNNGLPQTQLANELDVGKVALGSLIDRLQEGGFVTREADAKDRRVKRVFLTKKAHKLMSDIEPVSSEFNSRILEGVSLEEMKNTSRMLAKMKENLVALSNGNRPKGGAESDDGLD
ncbi:MarR family transcriptional regulator [Ferrovibrio terrae]|uniref:MarR family transcriptional regulator n=1 Tax=Ferrovibrio terrae TaxID=2594003 RepID=A0A516GXX5_9PROT|nr:MarR family transcriptional regulator [Ferrovibrio terrae]QDO96398.1 MarR family transcriptional regulator [Ferrovibrio terrae]